MQTSQRSNSVSGLNMSATERQISMLGGGILIAVGIEKLVRGKIPGALLAGLGSILMSSGVTGYLNPQEQVWKQTRRAVTHNHTLAKLPDLVDRFEQHLLSNTFHRSFLERFGFYVVCPFLN